jgi:serine/threonine protein kinase
VVLQKPYDHKADIYSFGVLCWTMLTGGIKCEGPDWCPPSHKFSAHNFTTLSRNHKLLEKAIKNPGQAGAQPLPSEKAVDLILSTTRPDPHQRPDHDRLRAHALMSAMKLPPLEARRHQVDEWLKTLSMAPRTAG